MSEPIRRDVYQADALQWLKDHKLVAGCSVVTSLPDWSEFSKLTLDEWKTWFTDAAKQVLSSTPDEGVVVFFQTDIKVEGAWVDKAFLCQLAAHATGHSLLWHKLVCKISPGHASYARPGYSHLICFSKRARAEVAHSTPDILPHTGDVTWARGMGVEACFEACRFIQKHTTSRTVVDPFCGHGTVLAVANSLGMDAIGVDLGGNRADKARRIQLREDGKLEFNPKMKEPSTE